MKTVKFFQNGDTIQVISLDTDTFMDKLEPAVYSLRSSMTGFYLSFKSEKFEIPKRVYGTVNQKADKVINTYNEREKSTGIMLTGDKGAGKTMLSSIVANRMIDKGIPVILIEEAYGGPAFKEIIDNIGECVLFFDEFGKVFNTTKEDGDTQNDLLSLFDGTSTQKRMILLTENETRHINQYIQNRPGRMFYHFKYTKLENQVIEEFCKEFEVPDDVTKDIVFRAEVSYEFSFDTLTAIVAEYKRYKEDIETICNDLNIEQTEAAQTQLEVLQVHDVNKGVDEEIGNKVAGGGHGAWNVSYVDEVDKQTGEKYWEYIRFTRKNMVKKEKDLLYFHVDDYVIVARFVTPKPKDFCFVDKLAL